MGYLRKSIKADAEFLKDRLRDADKRESLARYGLPPSVILKEAVKLKNTFSIIGDIDHEPIGMCGYSEIEEGVALVWMQSSNQIGNHKIEFLRKSKKAVEEWNDKFPVLYNFVDERNTLHIKWLQWLGFTFIRRLERYGVTSVPFLEFIKVK